MTGTDQERDFDIRLGLALRQMRTRAGLSQEALAAAAGITFQQIQKYEKGSNRLSVSRLRTLTGALGTSPAAFLAAVEPPEPADEKQDRRLASDVADLQKRIMTRLDDVRMDFEHQTNIVIGQLRGLENLKRLEAATRQPALEAAE